MSNPPASLSADTILEVPVRQITFGQDVWRRFRRNRLAVFGAGLVGLLVVVALFAPLIAPYSPTLVQLNAQFEPPSAAHPFGADFYGRDILSRVIYGARISLVIGLVPTLMAMLFGTAIGVLSGFQGGWVDTLLMRLGDVVMAFPSLILAMVVTYTLGTSLFTLFIALIHGIYFRNWPTRFPIEVNLLIRSAIIGVVTVGFYTFYYAYSPTLLGTQPGYAHPQQFPLAALSLLIALMLSHHWHFDRWPGDRAARA
jgi:hypothetical protein